jgi:hypothetical protein
MLQISGSVWKAALLGAAQGIVQSAILFWTSDRRTLSNDWFLAVMIIFANSTGFAFASRYGVSFLGVALAGLTGMCAGGWLGAHVIGSYEYKVPTPQEERVIRLIGKDGVKDVEFKHVPAETVKRIPIGGGFGVLAGFAFGAGLYVLLFKRRSEEPDVTIEQPFRGNDDDTNSA